MPTRKVLIGLRSFSFAQTPGAAILNFEKLYLLTATHRASRFLERIQPNACDATEQSSADMVALRPWPGAYGSDDDAMIDFLGDPFVTPEQPPAVQEYHLRELRHYREFLTYKTTHPRYKHLAFRGDST